MSAERSFGQDSSFTQVLQEEGEESVGIGVITFLLEAARNKNYEAISRYKNVIENSISAADSPHEINNIIASQFNTGLAHAYKFYPEKSSEYQELIGYVVALIASPSEESGTAFLKQFDKMALEKKEDVEEIGLELSDKKASQVEQSPVIEEKKAVTIGMRITQDCVKGILALQAGIDEREKEKAASLILACIRVSSEDASTLSKSIIREYKLSRSSSSGQVFSTQNVDLGGFLPELIKEVRRKMEDEEKEDVIHEFITKAVMDFNQGKVNYALWVSGMSERKAELDARVEAEVVKAKNSQAREHKRALHIIRDELEKSKEKVGELEGTVEAKDGQITRMEKEKKAAEKLHSDQIVLKDQQIEEKQNQIAELKRRLSQQKIDMERLHAAQIQEKDLELKKKDTTQVKKASSSSQELLKRIALLEKQLKIVIGESQEKDKVIAEKEESSHLSANSEVPRESARGTILSDEQLRLTQERLEQENTRLKNRVSELEAAAIKSLAEEKTPKPASVVLSSAPIPGVLSPTLSPKNLREMQDLSYCIDKIILPTLMRKSGNTDDKKTIESEKKAINEANKICEDLYAGTLDSKYLGSVKNYVRSFLKEHYWSSINEMHQNKTDLSVIKRMSTHYNALVSETDITTAKLKSISDELIVMTNIAHNKDAKSMSKNDRCFTDQDFNIIFAALQVEGMRENGWKIDNKKLKKLIKDELTEFTVPLILEKPGRLLWSNKQAVALRFSKAPDGSFKVTSSSKDAQALASRIAEGVAHPKQTRDGINEEARTKNQRKNK